jgi:hypothetical protein
MDMTNPLQSVVSVVDGGGESMLWCKPVIHVYGNAAESLNPSSAIECFVIQIAETEPSSMIHDKDWSPVGLGRLGLVDSNNNLGMVTHWDLPIFFCDGAFFCCSVGICEISLHLEKMRP